MATSQELADIILNRQSVALARSRRLVQSWLPSKTTTGEEDVETRTQQPAAEDDDFDGMTELQGVGSKRKAEDEGVLDGLKRKKLSSDDKLLELLLGKEAVRARKKSQEASRYGGRTAHKGVEKQPRAQQRDVSDDEEEGRASSFKSRKTNVKPAPTANEPKLVVPEEEDESARSQLPPQLAMKETPPPAKKRKAGSYLDEILGQKAAKQSKKKKKKHKLDAAEA
ncbi:hypothetical protein B0A55_02248 [Friedmanniomyces simplex]|uniref:Uncharacterized protein n=1 Tax=Friedmanniomyces simplex TaxID=329884 RepID=A0A4U0XUR0_9PEZI|nr:hypothetical protein B0A55_02248 [Friedmanniomyces simplex]